MKTIETILIVGFIALVLFTGFNLIINSGNIGIVG